MADVSDVPNDPRETRVTLFLENPAYVRLNKTLRRFAETMRRGFENAARGHERFRQIARPYLSDRGWIINPSDMVISAPGLIADLIDKGEDAKVEEEICAHIRSRANKIEGALKRRFPPPRALILADAFQAHSEGRYNLSIPTMLAQADGIGATLLGLEHFFTRRPPGAASRLHGILNSISVRGRALPVFAAFEPFLDFLRYHTSLTERTDQRDQHRSADPAFGPLNRHGVLHGIDTDYGTEANSLRAIALLDYLTWVHQFLADHRDRAEELRAGFAQILNEPVPATGTQ